MSFFKKLLGGGGSTESTENLLTERQRFVADHASQLVEVINESLQISNNSTNPSTKVSRLELARARLDSLVLLAAQYPFLQLQRLDGVRKSIDALAEEFSRAGYYAQTETDSRDYRQDVWRGIEFPTGDLIVGWRFLATIQLRTPLRVLTRDGEIHHGRTDPPSIARAAWEGIWLPVLRPVDGLPEFRVSTRSSDVGAIPSDGGDYLPLLIRLREIVEADTSIENRLRALRDELRRTEWADYCVRLGGRQAVCDKFFPPFVATIVGLSVATVEQLSMQGLTSPNALSAATDKVLLAIKGIGPAKLSAVRAACASARQPSCEYVDNVVR